MGSVTGEFEDREYDHLKEKLCKKTANLSSCAIEYVDDGEGNIIEVQDPIKVSTKGATKVDENLPMSKKVGHFRTTRSESGAAHANC